MSFGLLVPFHPLFQYNMQHEDEKTPPKPDFQKRRPHLLLQLLQRTTSAEGSVLGPAGHVPEVFSPRSPAVC